MRSDDKSDNMIDERDNIECDQNYGDGDGECDDVIKNGLVAVCGLRTSTGICLRSCTEQMMGETQVSIISP